MHGGWDGSLENTMIQKIPHIMNFGFKNLNEYGSIFNTNTDHCKLNNRVYIEDMSNFLGGL